MEHKERYEWRNGVTGEEWGRERAGEDKSGGKTWGEEEKEQPKEWEVLQGQE